MSSGYERARAELPLTDVEILAEITELTRALSNAGYRVVIAIDELDKLGTGDEAVRFLNGIKGLFPIQDCSFLVTISDSAWAQFAGRGIPLRDVFDSSLDEVVAVEPLTFRECRSLLRRRNESLSDAQSLVCYWLSGGLPREVLRYARRLGEANDQLGGEAPLSDVVQVMLHGEVEDQVSRIALEARSLAASDAKANLIADTERAIREWTNGPRSTAERLIGEDELFARSVDVIASFPEPSADADDADEAATWATASRRQLSTFIYFLGTVRDALTSPLLARLDRGDEVELANSVQPLANARVRQSVDAGSAWRLVDHARTCLELSGSG
jgi:hypothetical protein